MDLKNLDRLIEVIQVAWQGGEEDWMWKLRKGLVGGDTVISLDCFFLSFT
jgi:hypothetical protein